MKFKLDCCKQKRQVRLFIECLTLDASITDDDNVTGQRSSNLLDVVGDGSKSLTEVALNINTVCSAVQESNQSNSMLLNTIEKPSPEIEGLESLRPTEEDERMTRIARSYRRPRSPSDDEQEEQPVSRPRLFSHKPSGLVILQKRAPRPIPPISPKPTSGSRSVQPLSPIDKTFFSRVKASNRPERVGSTAEIPLVGTEGIPARKVTKVAATEESRVVTNVEVSRVGITKSTECADDWVNSFFQPLDLPDFAELDEAQKTMDPPKSISALFSAPNSRKEGVLANINQNVKLTEVQKTEVMNFLFEKFLAIDASMRQKSKRDNYAKFVCFIQCTND